MAHQGHEQCADDERPGVEDERPGEPDRAGQETGPGEPDGGRSERGDRQEGVGRRQFLIGRHLGDETLVGRVEELLHAGVEQDEEVQADDRVELDRDREERDHDRLDQGRDDHDLLAVVAVHVDAGQQPHHEARHGGRHEGQADGQGGPGLAVDPYPGSEIRQRRARRRDELGEPEEAEVALVEDGEHRRSGRERDGQSDLRTMDPWCAPSAGAESSRASGGP